jgi:autotransporter-associated beta strand protein
MTGSNRYGCGLVVLAAAALAAPAAAQERSTTWVRNGPAALWSDPRNWSNGVPDANTVAVFAGPDASGATVDLGGATARAARIDAYMGIGSRLRFINGMLSTPVVNGASGVVIDSDLTTDARVLRLVAGMDLTVSGMITGDMDVEAAGTFTGFQPYAGQTTVGQSLTLSNATVPVSPVRVLQGGSIILAGDTFVGDLGSSGGAIQQDFQPNNIAIETLRFTGGQSDLLLAAKPLEPAHLFRSEGATVHLNGSPGLRPMNPPATDGGGSGVTPWMVAPTTAGWTFAKYDRAGPNPGYRPMDLGTEYAAAFGAGPNVRLTSDATQSGATSADSLSLSGANLTLDGTLNLFSGGILMSGGSTEHASIRGTGGIGMTDGEAVVHVFKPRPGDPPSGTFSIEVPIAASALTKAGDGDLVLTRRNTFSRGVFLNAGSLTATAPGATGTGPLVFTPGARLRLDYASPAVSQDVVLNGPGFGFTTLDLRPGDVTFSGSISGDGRLFIRTGEGMPAGPLTVRLAGGGAATGAYELLMGATDLVISGDYASPDSTIFGGSRTYGTGTVRGELWNTRNTYSPGDAWGAPGRMTVGTLSSYGGTFHVDIAGRDAGTGYDQLIVLDRTFLRTDPYIDSVLELASVGGFAPSPGDQFMLIDDRFTGAVDGYFLGLPEGAKLQAVGTTWQISYAGGDGNDVVATVVPEPVPAAMLGVAGAWLFRRRRYRITP